MPWKPWRGWMSEQGLGDGPLQDVSAVTGGTQNVMLRFTRSGRPYVLRRGPRHLRPRSNSVILRETKVLAALAGSDVPHPHLIATCDDPGVLGDAVFYLMEPIDGFNAGEGLPPLHAGDPEVRLRHGAVDGRRAGEAGRRRPRRRRVSPISASRKASWNARCRAGFRSWSPIRSTTATPGRRSPASSEVAGLAGAPPADDRGRRASCTATTTPPT